MSREKDRPVPPDDLDPVVKEATEYATSITEPPKHHRWIDLTAYILLSLSLVFSSGAAVVSVVNSIKIEHEQACQARVNKALRVIADSDREAYDHLFKAILGTPGITALDVHKAYDAYVAQRKANDDARNKFKLSPNGKC